MNRPQSILIFLPDGSPRSVKIAEITNRVVKAVLIPRNKLEYIGQRDEAKNVGLYFLFGESSEKAKPIVYIGEAEDCFTRIKQHNREKRILELCSGDRFQDQCLYQSPREIFGTPSRQNGQGNPTV